jgi:hypothetical protein
MHTSLSHAVTKMWATSVPGAPPGLPEKVLSKSVPVLLMGWKVSLTLDLKAGRKRWPFPLRALVNLTKF